MLTLFFAVFAVMCPAHATIPLPPKTGAYSLGLDVQYLKSTANYTTASESKSLAPGAYLTNILGDVRASYDWAPRWRSYAGLSLSNTETSNGVTNHSNMGLNEVTAGSLMWFDIARFSLIPQVDFAYPFWHVDENGDSALLGEGALRLRGGVWALWRLHVIHPFLFTGFEYRDGGRSSLVPYAIGAHLGMHRFWMQLAYQGIFSAVDDSDSSDEGRATREAYLSRVNGGSFEFYSVNPSVGEVAFEAGVNLSASFKFSGELAMSLNGTNAADAWRGLLSLTFMGRQKVERGAPSAAAGSGNDENEPSEFKTEPDKYDESLFIDNGVDHGEKPKVHRRVRQHKSVDKLLNETEKQLDNGQ
jgi:hypothetical protein